MELFNKRHLWFPLLGLLCVFALDKIFLLPPVQKYTVHWQKIEPIFYQSRRALFEQLQQDYPRRTARGEGLALILGSSRSAEFDHEHIDRKLGRRFTYNFSAPFACPAFHFYWLEQILAAGMKPDFVLLEVDPLLLGPNAMEFTQKYSLDWRFVLQNTELFRETPADPWLAEGAGFSYAEAETYFLLRSFALFRYPFSPSTILENNRTIWGLRPGSMIPELMPARETRTRFAEFVQMANELKLGGIPNPLSHRLNEAEMEKDAEQRAAQLFSNYRTAPTQVIFLKRMLRALARAYVPVIVYWPVSAQPFQRRLRAQAMHRETVDGLRRTINSIAGEFPGADIRFIDPNDDPRLRCRDFVDSHHLSGACFPQLTDILLADLPRR